MNEPGNQQQSGQILILPNRDSNNQLIKAECLSLTWKRPVAVDEAGIIRFIQQAAYVDAGMRLLATGKTLEALLHKIGNLQVDFEGFRIEFFNLSSRNRLHKRATIIAVADALGNCRPNLDFPKHRLAIVVQDTGYAFGEIVVEPVRSYRLHDQKPHRTSSSLPSQLARGVINLVRPSAAVVLDPCCGTGSILLEAHAVGLKPIGGDNNPKMVAMSQKNLGYFGYDCEVIHKDAREWNQPVDAVVTDLPYNRFVKGPSLEVIMGILSNAAELAPLGVFITCMNVSKWLKSSGYPEVEVFRVPKSAGFARYIHLASR